VFSSFIVIIISSDTTLLSKYNDGSTPILFSYNIFSYTFIVLRFKPFTNILYSLQQGHLSNYLLHFLCIECLVSPQTVTASAIYIFS
jgi:hypothetical protein